jgi:hypothetical protein
MKLKNYISEAAFNIYQAIARFTHTDEIRVQDLGDMLRAVEGVVTIVQVDHDYEKKTAIMKVKVLSTKGAKEAYAEFKSKALPYIPELRKVEVAMNTIVKVV